jgi:hypothetical protein
MAILIADAWTGSTSFDYLGALIAVLTIVQAIWNWVSNK